MKRRRRGNGKVRAHIDGTTYEYEPAKLLFGIGSGRVRKTAGRNAEKVAAAMLLGGMRQSPLGAMFEGMTADELIESAVRLVSVGALTEDGLAALPPEFN